MLCCATLWPTHKVVLAAFALSACRLFLFHCYTLLQMLCAPNQTTIIVKIEMLRIIIMHYHTNAVHYTTFIMETLLL